MIIIHPKTNQYYYSFYLSYIKKKFKTIKYDSTPFPAFHHHCLALILPGRYKKKIYISAGDGAEFNEMGLEWCDIYAKVNLSKKNIPTRHEHKIFPIGPSFGIKYLNLKQILAQIFSTSTKSSFERHEFRAHLANFYRQWKYRLPLSYYQPGVVDTNYIFHASTLWKKEHNTNILRQRFMKISKKIPGIIFEGGFAPGKEEIVKGFEDLIISKKYNHGQYLENMKKSLVVFSNPAVQGCIGWKLAEYLACGKAIISMPIPQSLPSPLNDNEHLHLVDGSSESFKKAIHKIKSDSNYRKRLQVNARKYYLENLSPKIVLEKLMSAI